MRSLPFSLYVTREGLSSGVLSSLQGDSLVLVILETNVLNDDGQSEKWKSISLIEIQKIDETRRFQDTATIGLVESICISF